jgi:hypothetical protein
VPDDSLPISSLLAPLLSLAGARRRPHLDRPLQFRYFYQRRSASLRSELRETKIIAATQLD